MEGLVSKYKVVRWVFSEWVCKVCMICMPLCAIGQVKPVDIVDVKVDFSNPKTYKLGGIIISGTKVLDPNALILLSGLSVGEDIVIPGDDVSNAIRKLWKQGLFSDVQILVNKIEGDKIFIEFKIAEQPRLSRFTLDGVSKGETSDIEDEINLHRERIVTPNLLVSTKDKIRHFYVDKGYYNVEVDIIQKEDTLYPNHQVMGITVDKKNKVKIDNINFHGNTQFSEGKLEHALGETKEKNRIRPFDHFQAFLGNILKAAWHRNGDTIIAIVVTHFTKNIKPRIFKKSKYIETQMESDKAALIQKYKTSGYRDAKILSDSVTSLPDGNLQLDVYIEEGNKYFFRDIRWIGNEKYSNKVLNTILNIKRGDIYNTALLDERLFRNPSGLDISSQYMDDGYLFFQVTPNEVRVDNDSIDIEIKIYEGVQAHINKIIITGNTKTSEHVIRREIKTRPGDLFSRADLIRTQRELSILGYLDPEQMDVIPKPNPADGTVDIEYVVGEKPSDQVELSGGYGGNSIVGTIGLTFNNFSAKNFFDKDSWTPLPSGDGQRLSLRGQTSGPIYNSINLSFTEPWLGGKKPNSFSFNIGYTSQQQGTSTAIDSETGQSVPNPFFQSLGIYKIGVGLSKRLKWPDDHFQFYQAVNYNYYEVNNWPAFQDFTQGIANDIYYLASLSRNSVDDLHYPKSGSKIALTVQLTPPYSAFNNKDYAALTTEEKFEFVEYNKWKFTSSWYNNFVGKFVLYAKVGFGGLFSYSPDVGTAPFGRFYLGGSGLTGYSLDGREVIGLRGYDDMSLSPTTGSAFVTKYTTEIRYPFSTNPSALIYGLVFGEMGNTFDSFDVFNPYDSFRSAGVGIKVFLPAFGLLGLDWGYRFDEVPGNPNMPRSQIHFTIGANLGEL